MRIKALDLPVLVAQFALVAALVTAAPNSAFATFIGLPDFTIPGAKFIESVGGPLCPGGAFGTDDALPESLNLDTSVNSDQCVHSVLTSAIGPQADVQSHSSGLLGGGGFAEIEYYLMILAVDTAAPGGPVPVKAKVSASISASASGGSTSSSHLGAAFFEIFIDDAANGQKFFAEVCNDGNMGGCMTDTGPLPTSFDLNTILDLSLPVGRELLVKKTAVTSTGRGEGSADAQAVVDPIFYIDDLRYKDFYQIVYSPGIQPNGLDTKIPEPMTVSLFGFGLAGAICLRRRRKSRF